MAPPNPLDFKKFCIAADDWGISPAVNRGIIELCEAGIVRKVSLMATEKFLKNDLERLLKIRDISLGLHFNLTHNSEFESPAHGLQVWLLSRGSKKSQLISRVQAELESQIRILREAQIPLSHFDGHHHIHIIPGLLDAMSEIILRSGIRNVRIPYDPRLWLSARAPLNFFARQMQGSFAMKKFESTAFRYPAPSVFSSTEKLKNYLSKSIGAEILVHPATEDDFEKYGIDDPTTCSRVEEFKSLMALARP